MLTDTDATKVNATHDQSAALRIRDWHGGIKAARIEKISISDLKDALHVPPRAYLLVNFTEHRHLREVQSGTDKSYPEGFPVPTFRVEMGVMLSSTPPQKFKLNRRNDHAAGSSLAYDQKLPTQINECTVSNERWDDCPVRRRRKISLRSAVPVEQVFDVPETDWNSIREPRGVPIGKT